jgi:hypothetical protein
VSCRKALLHLGLEVDLDPIDALSIRRHTLGHGPDVAAEELGHDIEVPSRLRSGLTDLLPEIDNLLPETANLLPETANLLPETANLLPETANLLPETANLLPETDNLLSETDELLPETDKLLTETPQSLVKIGAGLSIHGRSLADRPRKPQGCPSGYIRAHRCAMASISTRAPAGSLAACTVERAGGTAPACRL